MKITSVIKTFFLSGLYIVFPIATTLYIIKIIFSFLTSFAIVIEKYCYFLKIYNTPHSELIVLIILIFILGITVKILNLEKKIQELEKKILTHIPIISHIYIGIKKIIAIFKNKKDTSSQSVVWVKIKDNTYIIGFIVGTLEKENTPIKDEIFYSIFIPATPNPVTGHYIIATEKEFYYNNLSREEAISIIISGGIIRPE